MQNNAYRKTSLKVKNGKVQYKNNHAVTANYWNTPQKEVIIDQEKPGKGFKHFLKKRDIMDFISIIPDWTTMSKGLDGIVLASGEGGLDGWYYPVGVIGICAWPQEMDCLLYPPYYKAHQEVFARLGVTAEKRTGGVFCRFEPDQIKAYQLLHIFLHELGHHVDRMSTKSKHRSSRGEYYAEHFAFEKEQMIWFAYQNLFNVVFP